MENKNEKAKNFYPYRAPRRDRYHRNSCQHAFAGTFNKAREKAKTISCASNLKQIGLSVFMYADDHDSILVPGTYRASPTSSTSFRSGSFICRKLYERQKFMALSQLRQWCR